MRCVEWVGTLAVAAALAGCGGGGGDEIGNEPFVTPPHQLPTLAVSTATSEIVAARTVAVVTSLRSLGFWLIPSLESVSPANPVSSFVCGGGGSSTITYVDADGDKAVSPGDIVRFESPGCKVVAFGNGSATVTILSVDADGASDVRVDVAGGTLPYLEAWHWTPNLVGRFRITLNQGDVWLWSDESLRLEVSVDEWLEASRIGLKLSYVPGNPPSPALEGGLDLTLHVAALGEGRLQVDTVGGPVSGQAPNSAPMPGSLQLLGVSASRLRISDAQPVDPGSFRLQTDSMGTGVYDDDRIISFLSIFDSL